MHDPNVVFGHYICTLSIDLYTTLTYFLDIGLHRIPLDVDCIDFSLENDPIPLDYFPCDESIFNHLGGYAHLPSCYKDIYPSFLNMDAYFGQCSTFDSYENVILILEEYFDKYNSQYEHDELNLLPLPSQLDDTSNMLIEEIIKVDISEDPNNRHTLLLGKILTKGKKELFI